MELLGEVIKGECVGDLATSTWWPLFTDWAVPFMPSIEKVRSYLQPKHGFSS